MWKKPIIWLVLLLLFCPDTHAARCKVDGTWYDYDSKQCNPDKPAEAVSQTGPGDMVRSETSSAQISHDAPSIQALQGTAAAKPYLRPWSEMAELATQHCQDRKSPPMGLDCLLKEESGYWEMHGNFSMPERYAEESKSICMARTSSFGSQATCMHNESWGYQSFAAELAMPDDLASAARDECMKKFSSWSQRGSCMSSANKNFKYPNGRNRGGRVEPASSSGYIEPPPGYPAESEVVTFRVRPPAPTKSANLAVTPPIPKALTIQQRAARLAPYAAEPGVLSLATRELESRGDFIELSAAVPRVEGTAAVSFSRPATVDTRYGVRFTEQDNSALGLELFVEAGRVYLVDFVVHAFYSGSYVLHGVLSGVTHEHAFEDLGGAIRNVTARLIAEESGTIGFSLKHVHGKGFTLHAVGISSIEAIGPFTVEPETALSQRPVNQKDFPPVTQNKTSQHPR